jgi:hypothetical protein
MVTERTAHCYFCIRNQKNGTATSAFTNIPILFTILTSNDKNFIKKSKNHSK